MQSFFGTSWEEGERKGWVLLNSEAADDRSGMARPAVGRLPWECFDKPRRNLLPWALRAQCPHCGAELHLLRSLFSAVLKTLLTWD